MRLNGVQIPVVEGVNLFQLLDEALNADEDARLQTVADVLAQVFGADTPEQREAQLRHLCVATRRAYRTRDHTSRNGDDSFYQRLADSLIP